MSSQYKFNLEHIPKPSVRVRNPWYVRHWIDLAILGGLAFSIEAVIGGSYLVDYLTQAPRQVKKSTNDSERRNDVLNRLNNELKGLRKDWKEVQSSFNRNLSQSSKSLEEKVASSEDSSQENIRSPEEDTQKLYSYLEENNLLAGNLSDYRRLLPTDVERTKYNEIALFNDDVFYIFNSTDNGETWEKLPISTPSYLISPTLEKAKRVWISSAIGRFRGKRPTRFSYKKTNIDPNTLESRNGPPYIIEVEVIRE